jgi:hypothetical protein
MKPITMNITITDHVGNSNEIHAIIVNIAKVRIIDIVINSWLRCDFEIGNWLNGSKPLGSAPSSAMMYANNWTN